VSPADTFFSAIFFGAIYRKSRGKFSKSPCFPAFDFEGDFISQHGTALRAHGQFSQQFAQA
jgi:hypothetical protein